MSASGRPKRESLSAQRESLSAQREGSPVSTRVVRPLHFS